MNNTEAYCLLYTKVKFTTLNICSGYKKIQKLFRILIFLAQNTFRVVVDTYYILLSTFNRKNLAWMLPSSRASSPSETSSSSEQILSTLTSISVTFSPTNGSDHVKTSIKFGNQYGWGEKLNCRMFITLFSYFRTAACGN